MKILENTFKNTLIKYNISAENTYIVCALSGGADSVALTHLLASQKDELGFNLCAAHFSHGLRPSAAEAELLLCQELCQSLHIPLFHGAGDTGAFAAANKMGAEEAARTLRYNFLQKTAQSFHQTAIIATAHNLDDQVETMLLHLVRGAGLLGLSGMDVLSERNNMTLFRPLLTTTRQEIEDYCNQNRLKYTIDDTNLQDDYARNKIRNRVVPHLVQINSAAQKNIAAFGDIQKEAGDYIFSSAQTLLTARGDINISALLSAHPAVQKAAVILAYPPKIGLEKKHIDQVVNLAQKGHGMADLPHKIRAFAQNGIITFSQKKDEIFQNLPQIELEIDSPVNWGNYKITCSFSQTDGSIGFDKNAISLPLLVRNRRAGDKICLGSFHKSLKKLMNEKKIPKNIRDNMPIVCDNIGVLLAENIAFDKKRAQNGHNSLYLKIEKM